MPIVFFINSNFAVSEFSVSYKTCSIIIPSFQFATILLRRFTSWLAEVGRCHRHQTLQFISSLRLIRDKNRHFFIGDLFASKKKMVKLHLSGEYHPLPMPSVCNCKIVGVEADLAMKVVAPAVRATYAVLLSPRASVVISERPSQQFARTTNDCSQML